jgi:alpha-L-fucosidase
VAEHHDGFPMYATDLTPWNAANMGPRRDVLAELARATRAAGLKFGVSSHRAYNWRYYAFGEGLDTTDPANAGLYGPPHAEDEPASPAFIEDWFARTVELMDRFRPDVLWFDFGWHFPEFAPYRPRVVATYYNRALEWGIEPVLQYKEKIPDGVAVLDIERGKLDDIRAEYWQTDTSVSYKSWCYIEEDRFRTVTSLVHDLVDIVSKNGNLLLNVGPRADGVIPDEPASLLRGLGEWLAVNGEAIYGTRPWRMYGEGPTEVSTERFKEDEYKPFTARDVRFTSATRGGGRTLYAICLGCPRDAVTIESLGGEPVASVSLLGSDAPLSWSQGAGGLTIRAPAELPCQHAIAFRVELVD